MIEPNREHSIATTMRIIAYSLIGIYGSALLLIGIVAAFKKGDDGNTWVQLLKSGFLILGGALTTITGYYFGSRGTQEAQNIAESAREELEENQKEFTEFKRQFSPTLDENENELELPEDEI